MKPGALTLERIAQGLSPDWTAEDRLLVVASILPGMQDDIYAGKYSVPGRPNITSLQLIMSMPAEECEAYRGEIEPRVKAYQDLVRTGMRGSEEAVAPSPADDPSSVVLGTLTPARRLELAQVGHQVAMGMRAALEAQEIALRSSVRGLKPHSDDAIEAMAIVLAACLRVGLVDTPGMQDDFVGMVVEKAAEQYAQAMSPEAIGKLCERTKALVKAPPSTKPSERPS